MPHLLRKYRYVSLLLLTISFTVGYENMVEAKNDKTKLVSIAYEGFADLGRIKMDVNSAGYVEVDYAHHPMVVSKTKPWRKKFTLKPKDVKSLFVLLDDDSVRRLTCPEVTLMPGQDVTLSELSVRSGTLKPDLQCSFVETPKKLVPVLKELESIYSLVKKQK